MFPRDRSEEPVLYTVTPTPLDVVFQLRSAHIISYLDFKLRPYLQLKLNIYICIYTHTIKHYIYIYTVNFILTLKF